MLAWSRLVETWVQENDEFLVICDDPWMFRHLSGLNGVMVDDPPWLWPLRLRLGLRGFMARCRVALKVLVARLALGSDRNQAPQGHPALLVYGHPGSDANGYDSYFGELMDHFSDLYRVLHVDCPVTLVRRLAGPRTLSLHAWGPLAAVLRLPFQRWCPSRENLSGSFGWLVARAATREGGTGQAAMIAWQIACQEVWVRDARPAVVVWPWENHSWERQLVRTARPFGVGTVGYQHTVVGRYEWNYSPGSNPDGMNSIPEFVLTSGDIGREILIKYGIEARRVQTGGSWRTRSQTLLHYDPDGPVFVALPFDRNIAEQILTAIRPLGAKGLQFLVKDHPLSPLSFDETAGVRRTQRALADQDGLGGVIYAATTVGLEAVFRWVANPSVSADRQNSKRRRFRRSSPYRPSMPGCWRLRCLR